MAEIKGQGERTSEPETTDPSDGATGQTSDHGRTGDAEQTLGSSTPAPRRWPRGSTTANINAAS